MITLRAGRHAYLVGKPRHLKGWRRGQFRPSHPKVSVPFLRRFVLAEAGGLDERQIRIEDQQTVGCCVGESCTSALEYVTWKQTGLLWQLSALWAYKKTQAYEGAPMNEDSGATIPAAMDVFTGQGCATDKDYPFDPSKGLVAPPPDFDLKALDHKLAFWARCTSLPSIVYSLAQGFPVVIGVDLPEAAMTDEVARSGVIPTPKAGDSFAGGHAIMLTAYDRHLRSVRFANSWGLGWGNRGYGSFSFDFVERGYATDAVTLRTIP